MNSPGGGGDGGCWPWGGNLSNHNQAKASAYGISTHDRRIKSLSQITVPNEQESLRLTSNYNNVVIQKKKKKKNRREIKKPNWNKLGMHTFSDFP